MAGKVTGPDGRPPGNVPADGADGSPPAVAPDRADHPAFADKLKGADAPTSATGKAPPPPTGSATADLAAELKAGKITPQVAVNRVIDRVVERQLGVNAPAATREKLRAALETAVTDDPLLADKIRSLG